MSGITDTTSFALAAVSVLAIGLFIIMQQPWFRRLTAGPHRRRQHHRRRRRPRFRRAA